MKKKFGEYVRISRGMFGCSSLWRGNNHYLYVRGNGLLLPFSEDCFRFEYLKIQSIVVTRTNGAIAYSIVFGLLAVASALLTVACIAGIDDSPSDGVLIVLAVLLGITVLLSLAVVAVNIVLGPTCLFKIRTSVRTERIRPLSRWREAKMALEGMLSEVELSQNSVVARARVSQVPAEAAKTALEQEAPAPEQEAPAPEQEAPAPEASNVGDIPQAEE